MNHIHYSLLTRTPLHIGSGGDVGAIDLPVQRERHTGFPLIPASSLKGSFADHWLPDNEGHKRLFKNDRDTLEATEAAWLFGSDTTESSFAGSLIFSEAKLLAFPIRSARGSYAWVTCPLMLQRAQRDKVLPELTIPTGPQEGEAIFLKDGCLDLNGDIVLEEYCFKHVEGLEADRENIAAIFAELADDELFSSISKRLVILSNGDMSHFATTACEVAQHVRINDETGTAESGGLFLQENVPADTLFYFTLSATASRCPAEPFSKMKEQDAIDEFQKKAEDDETVIQFGANATTGLGYCSLKHLTTKSESTSHPEAQSPTE